MKKRKENNQRNGGGVEIEQRMKNVMKNSYVVTNSLE